MTLASVSNQGKTTLATLLQAKNIADLGKASNTPAATLPKDLEQEAVRVRISDKGRAAAAAQQPPSPAASPSPPAPNKGMAMESPTPTPASQPPSNNELSQVAVNASERLASAQGNNMRNSVQGGIFNTIV